MTLSSEGAETELPASNSLRYVTHFIPAESFPFDLVFGIIKGNCANVLELCVV